MTYTIKLAKMDTEGLRQTVSEAFRAGQELALGDETSKRGTLDYYERLLLQIESQSQRVAEEAFEAGMNAPKIRP